MCSNLAGIGGQKGWNTFYKLGQNKRQPTQNKYFKMAKKSFEMIKPVEVVKFVFHVHVPCLFFHVGWFWIVSVHIFTEKSVAVCFCSTSLQVSLKYFWKTVLMFPCSGLRFWYQTLTSDCHKFVCYCFWVLKCCIE